MNERIRVPEVRLVGPAGEQIGIVAINDALRLAQESDLDLVEVAPTARPPVAKLMDYGKFKYESALKARESRKNQAQTVIKEIKLRPKIDPHDYGTKRGHVERFLKAGDKVKVTIMFRGREQSRPELGYKLLQRLAGDVDELGFVEAAPKQDGRNMIMVIGPHKRKAETKSTEPEADPKTEHSAAAARAERQEARAAAISAQSEAVAAAKPAEPETPVFTRRATPPPSDTQAPPASARPASSRPSGSGYAGSSPRPAGSGYAGSSPRPASSGAAGGAPRTPAPSAGSRPTGAPRPSAPRPAGPPRPAGTGSTVPGSSGSGSDSAADRPASSGSSGTGGSGPASSGPAAPRPAAPRPGAPRPAPPRPGPPRPTAPRPRPVSPVPAQRADTDEGAAKPADPAD
ncbi:MAG TPA: translation initiation factor IF-3 [Streptosporangiaceae bacterium]